jgi:DNA-binding SARP family transcriptional activator
MAVPTEQIAFDRGSVSCSFKLLGPLQVRINDQLATPSASKVRQVLALTLLRANETVSIHTLIEELWDDRPPRTAVTIVQTYIYQIRKLVAQYAGARMASQMFRTVSPGYLVSVPAAWLDFCQFERAIDRAQVLLDDGQTKEATMLLTQALALWHGPVLTDMEHGQHLRAHAAHLEERRMLALELRLRADMQLGRHRQLVAELKSLVTAHPYHEWLHAQLMIALHRSGRRGEALSAYRNARQVLNDELGLEPSADLERILQQVLRTDSAAS